jgi:hypothetical protein
MSSLLLSILQMYDFGIDLRFNEVSSARACETYIAICHCIDTLPPSAAFLLLPILMDSTSELFLVLLRNSLLVSICQQRPVRRLD